MANKKTVEYIRDNLPTAAEARLTLLDREIEECKASKEYRWGWSSGTSHFEALTAERDLLAQNLLVGAE